MKKIIFKVVNECKTKISEEKERITLQFRIYDKEGKYYVPDEIETGNFTIHLKDIDLTNAKQIIVNALMNSPYIDKRFEIEE